MTKENLLARISIDPNICSGKPCIKRHRIWVSLGYLAGGMTVEEIRRSLSRNRKKGHFCLFLLVIQELL